MGLYTSDFFNCYQLYIYIYSNGVYAQIWDNLDSAVGLIKLIKDEGLLLTFNSTIPVLGGIDRGYFISCLNVYTWIYAIFPAYNAYIISWFIKIVLSILGMHYLGKTIIDKNKNKNLYLFCGLLYGLASTHPFSSFGFATLPFLLAILVKLYRSNDNKYLILLLIYPSFSDLFLFGVFICGFILIFFFIDWIRNKKPYYKLLLAILALSIGYIIVNCKLLYLLLFSKNIRNDGIQTLYGNDVFDLTKIIMDSLINGVDHASLNIKIFIFPLCFVYFIYIVLKKIKEKNIRDIFNDDFVLVLFFILFNSIICGLDYYDPFKILIAKTIPFLAEFSFQRAVWLNPFLWCLELMFILTRTKNNKLKMVIVIFSFISIICSNGKYNEFGANIRRTISLNSTDGTESTFEDYFSEGLFNEIKEEINYKGEWSIAFGMHPSILQYNDIHTLDGYLSYYSKDYKTKFREIIAPELEFDDEHREYFDNSGIRAYIYSMETSYNTWKKEYKNNEANMYINVEALKKMEGKYIFSRVKIVNYKELGFKYVRKYSNNNSSYTIYLYELEF